MKILHLGCGRSRVPKLIPVDESAEIVTLDADSSLSPDIVCCLGRNPIALPDDSMDEAIAVHVLEHIGKQGETAEWFQFWEEIYRVLKPGGKLKFLSPFWSAVWAWADPTHTRALSPEALYFFNQANYKILDSPISPYRIHCDFVSETFQMIQTVENGPIEHFAGILTARKPLQPWWYS